MDAILLVAASAGAIGVDWPGDFTMTHDGRLEPREPRHVAPFVYTGVGIVKPQLFEGTAEDVFRLAPFFFRRRSERAAVTGFGSMGSGCMWGGRRASRKRKGPLTVRRCEREKTPVSQINGIILCGRPLFGPIDRVSGVPGV